MRSDTAEATFSSAYTAYSLSNPHLPKPDISCLLRKNREVALSSIAKTSTRSEPFCCSSAAIWWRFRRRQFLSSFAHPEPASGSLQSSLLHPGHSFPSSFSLSLKFRSPIFLSFRAVTYTGGFTSTSKESTRRSALQKESIFFIILATRFYIRDSSFIGFNHVVRRNLIRRWNLQYSGPHEDAIAYAEWLTKDERFSDLLVQISPSPAGHAFPRLKLRYKPSLVQARLFSFPLKDNYYFCAEASHSLVHGFCMLEILRLNGLSIDLGGI